MPEAFERCVREGGHVITKNIGKSKYIHVCYLNGKSYSGEVKTKKTDNKYKRK